MARLPCRATDDVDLRGRIFFSDVDELRLDSRSDARRVAGKRACQPSPGNVVFVVFSDIVHVIAGNAHRSSLLQ